METANCGCCRDDLPWEGRGTNLDISGCRFSLYPMTDNFVSVIWALLEKTDTSAVWSQSDALSTVYRGKLPYVADAVRALFINAWQPEVHMALEGQFSKGMPGRYGWRQPSGPGRRGAEPGKKSRTGIFRCSASWPLYPYGNGRLH